jgi:hypothetical protein
VGRSLVWGSIRQHNQALQSIGFNLQYLDINQILSTILDYHNFKSNHHNSTTMSSTTNTQKRQSILSSFVAHAKAHHEGMNQAYAAYYGSPSGTPSGTPAPSAPASLETSRNNSVVAGMADAPKGKTNANKLWTALKQHHDEMNAAYTAFYSPGSSRANSPRGSVSSTPRASVEEPRQASSASEKKQPTNLSKHWKQLKTKAVEHHRSVNAAYRAAYGLGY